MVVETRRRPVEALARAADEIAAASDLRVSLSAVARRTAEALDAELVVVRVADRSGALVARSVAPDGSALAAAVALSGDPDDTRQVAARAGAGPVASAPARWRGRVVGFVEVVRGSPELGPEDEAVLELAAGLLALAVRMTGGETRPTATVGHLRRLEVAGAALAVGGDVERAARHAVEVAVDATRARAGALWRLADDGPRLVSAIGQRAPEPPDLVSDDVVSVKRSEDGVVDSQVAVTIRAGRPPQVALELVYADEAAPSDAELPGLVAFAARAAHAVAVGERVNDTAAERDRAHSLLEVVAASIVRLSLNHVLATAVERAGEVLPVDRVGVYLRDGTGHVTLAAGRGLAERHATLAQDVFDLAVGPLRARDVVRIDVPGGAAVGVPLRVGDEPIGLLVVFPRGRDLSLADVTLLTSLAAQLAVAVQNARLHERATELGDALAASLASERQASERVRALYEISNTAQSLSFDATLRAVTATTARLLGAGAAVLRLRDGRGPTGVTRATYVEEERLAPALAPLLDLPELDPEHSTLAPFLEKGATAARLEIPVAPNLIADVVVLSLNPAAPLDPEAVAAAGSFLQQAGLVIDNARLHGQQQQFAETMQRSLLPRERPSRRGLDVGAVYESAAYVEVGGDVFDFLDLDDRRLAVVLGDVTGHGVAAAADMALAKFVFRSLAREHPEPAEFLRHANDVVVGEMELGAFVTMVYVTASDDGRIECACAGHPRPRLVYRDGAVQSVECSGLALGIEEGQSYVQADARLEPGSALVLYTDGVIEARRGDALFGTDGLDAVLRAELAGNAQAIADAVVSACRAFAGGELTDDCAIVVLKKT
jgi:serine phosphatase RsbU (regulator of sigma subunit)/GAF domain-containing protein